MSDTKPEEKTDTEFLLRELLARIHRDGGQHTVQWGLKQSSEDADVAVATLLMESDMARANQTTQAIPEKVLPQPQSIRRGPCDHCGNKRCPKAEDAEFLCSGSNEAGQVGRKATAPASAWTRCQATVTSYGKHANHVDTCNLREGHEGDHRVCGSPCQLLGDYCPECECGVNGDASAAEQREPKWSALLWEAERLLGESRDHDCLRKVLQLLAERFNLETSLAESE